MRIAFLTYEYPDARPGGIGSYVYRCAESLGAAGHEAHIFTLDVSAPCTENLPSGVFLHPVPGIAEKIAAGTLPGPIGALALNNELATYKLAVGALLTAALRDAHALTPFDVVEAAEYEALSLPLLLKPIHSLPVITQIHLGTAVNRVANEVPVEDSDQLAEALELAAIVGADAVYAATRSVVEVTRRITPFSRDVPIIAHPIRISPRLTPTPKDGPILFVGRLQKRKGCECFASAASIVLKSNPHAIVRIAGADTNTGPGGTSMCQEMERRIDPAVRDRILFLGELPQEAVRTEIRNCRFQVIPSLVENFANTAMDAFAAGRTVIYAAGSGLDDVLGEAAIRVHPLTPEKLASAMTDALRNDPLIADFEHRGLERVRTHFPIEAITQQRLAFYEQVIKNKRTAPPRSFFSELHALSPAHVGCILNAFTNILHSCVGIENFLITPGRRVLTYLRNLRTKLNRPPIVWLFGAGRHTTRLLGERYLWESKSLPLAGIIDDHPRFKKLSTYLGLPLRSSAAMRAALAAGEPADAILLSTDTLQDLFHERTEPFRTLGIDTPQLF